MNDEFTLKLWFMIHMIYDEFWWILMWDAKMVPAISGEAKVLSDMTFVDLPYEKPQKPMVVLGRFSAVRHGHVATWPVRPVLVAVGSQLKVHIHLEAALSEWADFPILVAIWTMSNLRNWKNELGWQLEFEPTFCQRLESWWLEKKPTNWINCNVEKSFCSPQRSWDVCIFPW